MGSSNRRNIALLRAAFGDGPLYAPTDDDVFHLDGIDFVSGYGDVSTAERFVIVKQPPHVAAFVALGRAHRHGRIVELGIAEGGSTALLALVAEPSRLLAVDIDPDPIHALEEVIDRRDLRASVRARYGVDQSDRAALAAVVDEEMGPEPLDLVIDDASHQLAPTRTSFEVLFPRLGPGGVYAIEDWHHDLVFRDAVVERLRTAGPEERATLFRSMREPTPDAEADQPRPLADLVIELVLALVRTGGDAVAEVSVDEFWLMVRRGPAVLDPTSFRLDDHVRDHFGYLS